MLHTSIIYMYTKNLIPYAMGNIYRHSNHHEFYLGRAISKNVVGIKRRTHQKTLSAFHFVGLYPWEFPKGETPIQSSNNYLMDKCL